MSEINLGFAHQISVALLPAAIAQIAGELAQPGLQLLLVQALEYCHRGPDRWIEQVVWALPECLDESISAVGGNRHGPYLRVVRKQGEQLAERGEQISARREVIADQPVALGGHRVHGEQDHQLTRNALGS